MYQQTDPTSYYAVALIGWLVCFIIGAGIGSSKGKGGEGALLGLLLGPLGLILIALSTPTPEVLAQRAAAVAAAQPDAKKGLYRECPHCKEDMRRDAGTCPHCRLQSDAWVFREDHWWANGHWLDEATLTWNAPTGTPAQ